jgi:hypothetical protein
MKSLNSGAGQRFFSKENMNFWGTKIEIYPKENFFVTSDRDAFDGRAYTIRFFNLKNYRVYSVNFSDDTIGFGEFSNLDDVKKAFDRITDVFHVDNFTEEKINYILDNLTKVIFTESDEIKLIANHKEEYIIA